MRKTIIIALFYGLITNIYPEIKSTSKLNEQANKYKIEKLYQKSMMLKNSKKYNKAIANLKK